MWIARNKDGFLYAFIVKPRRITGLYSNYWITSPDEPVWYRIPYEFIILMDDRIKNMTWEDDPIEVELRLI